MLSKSQISLSISLVILEMEMKKLVSFVILVELVVLELEKKGIVSEECASPKIQKEQQNEQHFLEIWSFEFLLLFACWVKHRFRYKINHGRQQQHNILCFPHLFVSSISFSNRRKKKKGKKKKEGNLLSKNSDSQHVWNWLVSLVRQDNVEHTQSTNHKKMKKREKREKKEELFRESKKQIKDQSSKINPSFEKSSTTTTNQDKVVTILLHTENNVELLNNSRVKIQKNLFLFWFPFFVSISFEMFLLVDGHSLKGSLLVLHLCFCFEIGGEGWGWFLREDVGWCWF